jgi:hypothetical protein
MNHHQQEQLLPVVVVRRGSSPTTSDHSLVPNLERRPLARDHDHDDHDEEVEDDGRGNVIMKVVSRKHSRKQTGGCLNPAPSHHQSTTTTTTTTTTGQKQQQLTSMIMRVGFIAFPLFVLFEIARDARAYFYYHTTTIGGSWTKTKMPTTTTTTNGTKDDDDDDEPKTAIQPPVRTEKEEAPSAAAAGGLRAIVTGLEHSGTTLTGSLLMNAPCVMGAFETGYLLASEPRYIEKINPWFSWNYAKTNTLDINYRLMPQDVELMKGTADFEEMYDLLRHRSYLFNELNDDEYCARPTYMIDKTPLYVYPIHLKSILEKTPGVPVIVTKKGYDDLEKSWRMRNDTMTRKFYNETFDNVYRMMEEYPGRILIVHEEEMMRDPDVVMTGVFEHVGLVWKTEYLRMTGLLKKFSNDTRTMKRIEEWIFKPGKHNPDRMD